MRDPRMWRELFIRGGMTLMIAAICFFILRVGPWVWAIPAVAAALVLAKWAIRPPEEEGNERPPEIGDP